MSDQPKVVSPPVVRIFPVADGAYKFPARDTVKDAAFEKTAAQTEDGFVNFSSKVGVAARGTCGPRNIISKGTYEPNEITRNRLILEFAYRGSWIAGKVIDCPAEDMTREGVSITTNERADKVADIKAEMTRLDIMGAYRECIQWGALYGGCIGVYQIEGQKLASPLKLDTIQKGQFKGISVYDRWQLWPVLTELIETGPEAGLPKFYDLVQGQNIADPQSLPGYASGEQGARSPQGTVRIHHSRLFRLGGHKLPFYQAITEMLWDQSILERMWDRLIAFDDATMNSLQLIAKAHLRMIKFANLRDIMAAGPDARKGLEAQVAWMREQQSNEGMTAIDKDDEFETETFTFTGLPEMLREASQQVSGASNIPLVRLFCQSPSGLNATGDADLRMYYDSIKMRQEAKMRNPLDTTIKILWRSLTGEAAPKDMQFTFNPLWQLTAVDRTTVGKNVTDTILEAHDKGVTSQALTLKELKQASPETGLFTHITDEDIEQAEDEPPPSPNELQPEIEPGQPGEGPAKPKAKAGDSAWSRFLRAFTGPKKSVVKEARDAKRVMPDLTEREWAAVPKSQRAHVKALLKKQQAAYMKGTEDDALNVVLGKALIASGVKGLIEKRAKKAKAKDDPVFALLGAMALGGSYARARKRQKEARGKDESKSHHATLLELLAENDFTVNPKHGKDENVSDHQRIKDWLAKN